MKTITALFDTTYSAFILRRKIGSVLMCMLITGVLGYGMLVKQTVSHVVERKALQADKALLHNELATLEHEYLKATHALTKERAVVLGFVETVPHYTLRTGLHEALTLSVE